MSVAQVTEVAGKTREMTAEAYQAMVERAEAALQAARDKVGTSHLLTCKRMPTHVIKYMRMQI